MQLLYAILIVGLGLLFIILKTDKVSTEAITKGLQSEIVNFEFGKRKFKGHKKDATWFEARAICSNDGGTLTDIRSKEEYDYLVEMIDKHMQGIDADGDVEITPIWIGGSDINHKGIFTWVSEYSGSNPSKFFTQNRDPDVNGSCLFVMHKEQVERFNPIFRLQDGPCNEPSFFICSYP